MIRTYDKGIVELEDGSVLNRVEVYCGSGDTKPTSGIVNGSTLTEVDTGKTYLFDESNSSWTEVSTGGGGGGSSSGVNTVTVAGITQSGSTMGVTKLVSDDLLSETVEIARAENPFLPGAYIQGLVTYYTAVETVELGSAYYYNDNNGVQIDLTEGSYSVRDIQFSFSFSGYTITPVPHMYLIVSGSLAGYYVSQHQS